MNTFPGVSGEVYYRKWLVDSPIASIVFLHGFGEHSGLYQRLAVSLNDARINLWALDLPGHGNSEGARGRIGSLDDLVENSRRLTSIATADLPDVPVVLAGHSFGGLAAALSVGRDADPYAAAVLAATPLSPVGWLRRLARTGAVDLELDPAALSIDLWYPGALLDDPLAFTSARVAQELVALLPPVWDELDHTLERATIPLLLVHGTDDPLVPVAGARAWTSRLPDARLAVLDGARHAVLNELGFRAVAASVIEFVRRSIDRVRV